MIHIKTPYISNFNFEPLDKYDEEQFDDFYFINLLKEAPVRGFSKWQDSYGCFHWKSCLILEYDSLQKIYIIKWD